MSSLEWFRSRAEAEIVIENWRRHFNTVRPHSSLDYQTPAEFAAKLKEQTSASIQATGQTCRIWGLRAPARCSTAPQGASGTTSKGSRLKLKLVRRNRAGQDRFLKDDAVLLWASSGGDRGCVNAPLTISRNFGRFFDLAAFLGRVTSYEFPNTESMKENVSGYEPGTYRFGISASGANFDPVAAIVEVSFETASEPVKVSLISTAI